jgi:hypothetical protein
MRIERGGVLNRTAAESEYRCWTASALWELALSLPLSINQSQDQYRTPGYRLLIMKLIRFESLHCPEAGQTTMSA